MAFVTFKETQGAETAVLLTVLQFPDFYYMLPLNVLETEFQALENKSAGGVASFAVQKAEDVVSSKLAKGFILGKDALNKAKALDEKNKVISAATAKVASLDQKIGLSEKITIGATIVNDKVKEVDQKFQVSEKMRSAFDVAEQTVSSAGSAIMKNGYILTSTSWVTGALSRFSKAAGEVSQKTMCRIRRSMDIRIILRFHDVVNQCYQHQIINID
ncbi:hypothetical protein PHJA_002696800 [Phtheirospermum japonicum]|uniref:Uncharacterized protein n=1 Tax=Phtheirospermum japonicum TaxID=374723 RepID=A0A830D1I3_9LAMI|nr:hypothetical protein PHJA_002696800 [Phtheirospermum japonicum]